MSESNSPADYHSNTVYDINKVYQVKCVKDSLSLSFKIHIHLVTVIMNSSAFSSLQFCMSMFNISCYSTSTLGDTLLNWKMAFLLCQCFIVHDCRIQISQIT